MVDVVLRESQLQGFHFVENLEYTFVVVAVSETHTVEVGAEFRFVLAGYIAEFSDVSALQMEFPLLC